MRLHNARVTARHAIARLTALLIDQHLNGETKLVADENVKEQINVLEKAFRRPITPAVAQSLNRLRRNSVTGLELLRSLSEIYLQHNMRNWLDRRVVQIEEQAVPRIICSEAFL